MSQRHFKEYNAQLNSLFPASYPTSVVLLGPLNDTSFHSDKQIRSLRIIPDSFLSHASDSYSKTTSYWLDLQNSSWIFLHCISSTVSQPKQPTSLAWMMALLFLCKPPLSRLFSTRHSDLFSSCRSDHTIPLLFKTHQRLSINPRLKMQMLNIAHKSLPWPGSHLPVQPHLRTIFSLSLCKPTTLAFFLNEHVPSNHKTWNTEVPWFQTVSLLVSTSFTSSFRFYLSSLPLLGDLRMTSILWLITPFLSPPRMAPSPH